MKIYKPDLILSIGITLFLCLACPVGSVAQPKVEQKDKPTTALEEVVVVGTRRKERLAADLAVPVDVISRLELGAQGNSNILDTLTSILPSYNVNPEAISDAATLIRPVSFRGLPADSTLVLLNGKRRHKGAVIGELVNGINKGAQSVDLYPLPGIGLKQVEVLRDGAAAQYGSDAIAGVINFVLEDDPDIARLNIQYGASYAGDGDNLALSGVFGTHLGQTGFATVAFEIKDAEPNSRGSQDPAAQTLVDAGNTAVADPVVIWGSPEVKNDYKFVFNAAVEAGDSELYGFGNWSTREVEGSFFWRNPNTRGAVFSDGAGNILVADLTANGTGNCPVIPVVNGIADPTALTALAADPDCFSFNEIFPGGFTPRFGGVVNDSSIVGGFRGEWNNRISYDISVSAGRNKIDYRITNTINASLGPDTPLEFDLGTQIQFENIFNADFSTPVDVGAASDLNVAFGMQYFEETFQMIARDPQSYVVGAFTAQGFGWKGDTDKLIS
ncbi:MAG: TonB-dependent receptor plug domain-containing protein [Pseudomonadales bacterium]